MDEGSKLKERRERLGKSEVWIEEILAMVLVPRGANTGGHGQPRRRYVEDPVAADISYSPDQTAVLQAAYAAALDAEERTQGEPECPKGVVRGDAPEYVEDPTLFGDPGKGWQIRVALDGTITLLPQDVGWTERQVNHALLTYVADLSVWRAEVYAERQRRQAAEVKAAEDAYQAAHDAYARAEEAMTEAATALRIARAKAAC